MPGPRSSPVNDVSLGSRAQAATRGEELLSPPVGALCRPGPPLEAVELRDHWVRYRWSGENGSSAETESPSAALIAGRANPALETGEPPGANPGLTPQSTGQQTARARSGGHPTQDWAAQ